MRLKRLRICLIVITVAVFWRALALAEDKPTVNSAKQDFLQVAAEGYSANRDSFEFFTCRFRITVAKAISEEKALIGEWTDPVTSEVLWIVDGKKQLHQETANPSIFAGAVKNATKRKDGGLMVVVPVASHGNLCDGENGINHSPQMGGANLVSQREGQQMGIFFTPFSMGAMGVDETLNPAKLLRKCKDGDWDGQKKKKELVDGRQVFTCTIGRSKQDKDYQYSFDLEHGFIPVVLNSFNGQVKYIVTKIRECSGERWVPDRSVAIMYPKAQDGTVMIREIKVLEFDTEKRPKLEDFKLHLPAKTRVVNKPPDMFGWYVTEKDEDIRLEDLPKMLEKCKAIQERKLAARQAKESATWYTSYSWPLGLLVAGLALTYCGIVWWFRGAGRGPLRQGQQTDPASSQ